ncbi:hypothetical protein [Bacillus timonensis]|uniref:hypothetical protein n=1 Tax=Bacillus timonensis TaxID=1033734 RepID=UPI00028920CC|nr:hypothetical protein [Bacillus timonensis]
MAKAQVTEEFEHVKPTIDSTTIGPLLGFISVLILGFGLYFFLTLFQTDGTWLPYETVIANAHHNLFYKFIWLLMNFTEAQFYAGALASIFMIVGAFIAWRLDVKRSPLAGIRISYGSNLWPWIFASQFISVAIAIFILNYTNAFSTGEYTWLPTFISVVAVPPAVMLLYGPSYRALFTGSILGGLISYPVAFWIMTTIIPVLGVPGVVSNVLTMAITGIVVYHLCHVLPWMKKVPAKEIKPIEPAPTKDEMKQQMSTPSWFVRRVLADFTEAPFYGNEIASIFLLVGVSIEWILNSGHGAYASGAIPAIILSQFISAAVGIYLFRGKYIEQGWYATYVPVVSVGPACVLMFGPTIPVAVFAGVLGGIIGAPVAEYFARKLPEHIHPTVANVTSMALCTIVVAVVMNALPWF